MLLPRILFKLLVLVELLGWIIVRISLMIMMALLVSYPWYKKPLAEGSNLVHNCSITVCYELGNWSKGVGYN